MTRFFRPVLAALLLAALAATGSAQAYYPGDLSGVQPGPMMGPPPGAMMGQPPMMPYGDPYAQGPYAPQGPYGPVPYGSEYPADYDGYDNGFGHGWLSDSAIMVPFVGPVELSATLADRGLGYEGSYLSAQSVIPLWWDELQGWWLIDARGNVSDRGGIFTNIGLVRRTHFRPMGADFGVGVFYDYDGDQYEDFGHDFHQVGINAHMYTNWVDFNVNGYVPVGETDYFLSTNNFLGNQIVIQRGIDVALKGFEFESAIRLPGWAHYNGTVYLGAYNYRAFDEANAGIEPFGGFRGAFSLQPVSGLTVETGLTTDNVFETTGYLRLTLNFGDSKGWSPSGRDLDPVRRNAHIVRFHENPTPTVLTNPENNNLAWNVVHVDNAAPGLQTGTFENPFATLAQAEAAADNNTIIYVREGNAVYTGGIELTGRQRFFGEGVAANANSGQFIPTNEVGQFNVAILSQNTTNRPQLSNNGGTAIAIDPNSASDVIVSGFDIVGPTTTGISFAGNSNGPFGGSEIHHVSIDGATTGVNINNTTSLVTFNDVQIDNTVNGVNITNSNGEFVFNDTDINNATAVSFNVNNAAPTIEYNGNITNNVGGNELVRIQNTDAGTSIEFNGDITGTNTTGILVDTNADGEITFGGPINLTNDTRGVEIVNNIGMNVTFLDQINLTNNAANDIVIDNNNDSFIGFGGAITFDNAGSFEFTNNDDEVAMVVFGSLTQVNSQGIDVSNNGEINVLFDGFVNLDNSNGITINNNADQVDDEFTDVFFNRVVTIIDSPNGVEIDGNSEFTVVRFNSLSLTDSGSVRVTNNFDDALAAFTGVLNINTLGAVAFEFSGNADNAAAVLTGPVTIRNAITGVNVVNNDDNTIFTMFDAAENSRITNVVTGINIANSSNVTISGVEIDNAANGVVIAANNPLIDTTVWLLTNDIHDVANDGVFASASNLALLNLTIEDNIFDNIGGDAIDVRRNGAGITEINLSAFDNDVDAGLIFNLEDNAAGDLFNVEQASEAAMEAANPNANVVPDASINFGQPAPQLPQVNP